VRARTGRGSLLLTLRGAGLKLRPHIHIPPPVCKKGPVPMLVWYSNLHTVSRPFRTSSRSAVLRSYSRPSPAHAEQPFMTIDEKLGWRLVGLPRNSIRFTTEVRGISGPTKLGKKLVQGRPSFARNLLPKEIVIDQNGGDSMEEYSFRLGKANFRRLREQADSIGRRVRGMRRQERGHFLLRSSINRRLVGPKVALS